MIELSKFYASDNFKRCATVILLEDGGYRVDFNHGNDRPIFVEYFDSQESAEQRAENWVMLDEE